MFPKIKRLIDGNKRSLGVSCSVLKHNKCVVCFNMLIFNDNCKMSMSRYLKYPNILEFIRVGVTKIQIFWNNIYGDKKKCYLRSTCQMSHNLNMKKSFCKNLYQNFYRNK